MMLQLLGESLLCVGMLQLYPSRDLARQALLFLRRFVLSFFVPPNYYRVTKNRKRRGCEGGYCCMPSSLIRPWYNIEAIFPLPEIIDVTFNHPHFHLNHFPLHV